MCSTKGARARQPARDGIGRAGVLYLFVEINCPAIHSTAAIAAAADPPSPGRFSPSFSSLAAAAAAENPSAEAGPAIDTADFQPAGCEAAGLYSRHPSLEGVPADQTL